MSSAFSLVGVASARSDELRGTRHDHAMTAGVNQYFTADRGVVGGDTACAPRRDVARHSPQPTRGPADCRSVQLERETELDHVVRAERAEDRAPGALGGDI